MHNKKLKKIMTDLAAGHITQKEADEILGKKQEEKTQMRKLNAKGGKK